MKLRGVEAPLVAFDHRIRPEQIGNAAKRGMVVLTVIRNGELIHDWVMRSVFLGAEYFVSKRVSEIEHLLKCYSYKALIFPTTYELTRHLGCSGHKALWVR